MDKKETKITAFYVENFKAIRKGTWFELNKLNILTGANSSGKSTLFKAMKVFTEGFVEGDIPVINVRKVLPDAGFYDDLLHFNSKEHHFCLGFRFQSSIFRGIVEVKFKFVANEKDTEMTVSDVIIKLKNKHFLSFYRPEHMAYMVQYENKYKQIVTFPGHGSRSPGELVFAIDLGVLAASRKSKLFAKYEDTFLNLQRNFPDGIWTGELLNEDDYYLRLPFTRFAEEIFFDFYRDSYCNLYNDDLKYPIFHDDDQGEAENDYSNLSLQLNYKEFIKDYFFEFFNEISTLMRFFHQKRLFHLDLVSEIQKRIIDTQNLNLHFVELEKNKPRPARKHPDKPSNLPFARIKDFQHYGEGIMYSWLKIFGLPGYFITREIENGYHQVFYVDEKDRDINIADLGKGHAKLIQLMLSIGYKLFILSNEDDGKLKNIESLSKHLIIHVEEPEAYMHPKWQSLLADFFVMLTEQYRVQFLIETHSVYLIQKIQLLVARNKLDPNEVSLLYFEQVKKDVNFRRINIRKDGLLKESFGEGFYDESAALAVALIEHQNLN